MKRQTNCSGSNTKCFKIPFNFSNNPLLTDIGQTNYIKVVFNMAGNRDKEQDMNAETLIALAQLIEMFKTNDEDISNTFCK